MFLWVLGSLFLSFGISGDHLLLQGDEIMHIRTIRESIDQGAVLHPILSGFSNPYKPPLLFWIGMVGDAIFGMNFWSERLPSVIAGGGVVAILYWILVRWNIERSTALFIGILSLTSLGILKFSKLVMMEIFMIFFLLAFLGFYLEFLATRNRVFLGLSALAIGIGTLLKGPLLIIYAGILLAGHWVLSRIRVRNGKSVWVNPSQKFPILAGPEVKILIFLWAPIAVAPLFIWLTAIILFTDQGWAFTKFFIGTENLGKFGEENQPEGRLLLGILGYTIPWTVVYLGLTYQILRNPYKTKRQMIAKWLIVSAIFLILLHLLPNRKDAYYTLPSIVLGYLAIGFVIKKRILNKILVSKYHLGFQLFIAGILLISGLVLESPGFIFLSIPLAVFLYGIVDLILFHRKKGIRFASGILAPILSLVLFQSFLLPSVPDRLPNLSELEGNKYCAVSENPWDAWEIANANPEKVIHHSPFLAGCKEDSGILLLSKEEIPLSQYKILSSWRVWSGKIPDLSQGILIRSNPSFFKIIHLIQKNQEGKNTTAQEYRSVDPGILQKSDEMEPGLNFNIGVPDETAKKLAI